jgi:hypothetical protein
MSNPSVEPLKKHMHEDEREIDGMEERLTANRKGQQREFSLGSLWNSRVGGGK